MASQKMATVEITCNTKRATERLNEYVGLARKKINELAILNDSLNEKRRLGLKITDDEIKRQKQLETEIKELNTAQTRGIDDMKKAREVLNDLANSSIKEVNKAIRDMTKEMNGLRDVKGIRRIQQDIDKLRVSLDEKAKVSITELTGSLKNLNNISTEKLRQNLQAIRKEMEREPEDTQWARYLKNAERATQAQIAINEYGRMGKAPATGSLASGDRLRAEAERQRLVTAYQAASRSDDAAHKTWAAQALKEIQQYNSALQALTETERKDLQLKREESERNERLVKEKDIINRIANGQKVTLEELIEVQKHYKAEIEKMQGLNITDPDEIDRIESLNTGLRLTESTIRKIRAEAGGDIMKGVNDAAKNLDKLSIDKLADISKRGKELFSVMAPDDSDYDQLKADLIAIDAELERVTPKWNELAQAEQALAKATDVANRAFADDKVMLNELTEAQKTLEAQIKKMSGLALDPADEMELEKAKAMLDEVNKALDDIAMKDIDFNNLDATPTEKLESALKNLEQQEKRLAGTQKDEAEEVANKKALIRKQLEQNKLAVMDVARAEQIAANRGKFSVQELKQAYETLQQKLLTLNTNQRKDIARTKADMTKLKTKIDEVTGAVKKQSSTWDSAVKNITAYVGVFGAFNFIKNKIMDVFKANTKLSDSLADIRKVSGLSSDAINELYRNISKIDSRNTIETLNQLAYTGAKLGIGQNYGVEGLTGFVKAAEQVQMALGEDMGEKALPELSKMVEVMGLIDKYGVEQSMQKAASAIFQLGATSTATGTNIVEFSKRLMGLANVSRVSAQDLMGLASASDAMGIMPEVGATAFNKLFTSLQKNHNLIEKSLEIEPGTIKGLYDAGKTMDAIVLIFEKMQEKGNMNLLGSIFKDLGSDGARLVNVMATMADRADILRKHLATSRDAFKEGEAVIGEYMIQNQTAAALLERSANLWAKAFVNPEGVDMVKELAQAWYELSKSLTQSEGMMASLHGSLKMISLAIESLIKMFPFLLREAVALGAAFGFKSAITGVISLVKSFGSLINAIRGVHTAMGALDLVMKSNAIWMIAASIISVISLLYDYSKAAEEAAEREAERQAELKKAFDGTREAVNNAVKPLETYKKVLDEANLSEKQKMEMVRQFKRDYQEYLDYLGIEINNALDLAKAYAKVVDIMKIKKAYEEREDYRTQLNGETRMERIGAQSKVEGAARAFGLSDVDKEYLEKNQKKGTDKLYRELIERKMGAKALSQTEEDVTFIYVDDKLVNAGSSFGPRAKKRYKKVGSKELYNAIDEYIASFRKEKKTDEDINRQFDTEYSWTDKNGKKRKLSEFNIDEYNETVQKARWKRGGTLENEAPDKAALAAARKAQQDEKQAIRKELQDAKQESDAIIAKIEEWYRLQETVVTGFAADGKWTQQQAEMVNRELEAAKNEALANARLAISGRDTQTWEQTKESLRVMMFDTGQWSQELFQQMMDVSMASIRQNLSRIDKEGGQYGITTSSLKDGLDKNAAGNRRKVQEIRNKTAKEVEKALLQYDYFEQAVKAFEDRLDTLGILAETAEQAAERIRKASGSLKTGGKTEEQLTAERSAARRKAGEQFIKTPGQSYAVDYQNTADLNRWLSNFSGAKGTIGTGGMEFQFTGWAEAFKDEFNLWLKDSEKYKAQIQAFYLSLVDFDTAYYDAVKKNYDEQKKQFDSRWNASGKGQAYEEMQSGLDRMSREQKMTGADQGTNFAQQAGFASLGTDPEIAASQLRMQQMQDELDMFIAVNEKKKLEGAALEAYNQQLAERQRAADEAQLAMAETVMAKINDRIAKLQEWTAPIEQFGADVGDAMGKAVFESENMVDGMKSALKNLAQAWGEHTIQIIKELMMQQLKQKMINKAMKKEQSTSEESMTDVTEQGEMSRENLVESIGSNMVQATAQFGQQKLATKQQQDSQETTQTAHKTIFDVLAGIAGGSAKTIESLGWWGIPLVAVISALLMGLLNTALSALGGGGSNEQKAAAKPKVKLASGMLTYDSGNLQEVVGEGRSTSGRLLPQGRKNVQQTVGSQWRGKNGEYITDERRTVVGDDGRVYRAREQRSLPEGVSMVTEPIATRVNGQQALVGERGPEIVIGRRTTRAIQMNRPDLLRDLALIDRGITTRKVRTFDEGNISDMASAFAGQLPAPQSSADGQQGGSDAQRERDQAMLATLGVLSQTIGQLQQQLAAGIHAEMNMFGDNGAYKKFQQADKFYKKYGG